jgi:hypothetical protein
MWRAFFLAIAITFCLLGAECLIVERATLARPGQADAAASLDYGSLDYGDPLTMPVSTMPLQRTVEPADWHPWTLLALGAVTMLYALTMRKGGSA